MKNNLGIENWRGKGAGGRKWQTINMKKLIFCLAFTKIPENRKLMSSALRNACLYINTLLYEKKNKKKCNLKNLSSDEICTIYLNFS